MAEASGGQLSFFSADAHPRAVTDLEGVLCARGQLSVFGRGTTARLSIVLGDPPPVEPSEGPEADDGEVDASDAVADPTDQHEYEDQLHEDLHGEYPYDEYPDEDLHDEDLHDDDTRPADDRPDAGEDAESHASDASDGASLPTTLPTTLSTTLPTSEPDPVAEWRAHALCCAFRTRGVDAEIERLDDGRPVVRSAYRADLVPLARAWTRGAVKAFPADLDLDGPRLRLWILAAGRHVGRAYVLGLDPHAPGTHEALLTACRRAGLGATLGGDRAAPVLRIVGRRRQARLAELAGGRPASLVDGIWPG